MNQPTQQAPTTPTEASPVAPTESYEDRVSRVFAEDGADTQSADDPNGNAPSPPAAGAPADSASGNIDEERRQRLARLTAEESARVDAQAKHREIETIRKQLAEAQQKQREAEARAQGLVDPNALDEDGFFGVLDKVFERVPADKLGQKIRERMTNPEIAAASAAKKALDPEIAALREKLAQTESALNGFMQQHQSATEQAAEAQAAHEFGAYVAQSEAVAPRAAAFLREFGGQDFYQLALSAAAKLPEGAGAQAILDRVEEDLIAKQETAARLSRVYAPIGATTTQQRQAPTPHPGAAKPMTTVSNTLAQQRASVVDEDAEWASLPFEERSARLFR